ncbi:class I glutamine amidotransferase-like protein [Pyronema omphalodes]|nr:class I glutamine amidotransferase-like protein [Pyronema omphalodes]
MSNKRVLIILSSASSVPVQKSDGSTAHPETGFFLKELAQPLMRLLDAGYTPTFASPNGAKPNMDPMSDNALWFLSFAEKEREKALIEKMNVEHSFSSPVDFKSLTEPELRKFSGIFIPGGHAPMTDLGSDNELGRILRFFHNEKKPTAAICHGPVALLSTHVPGEVFCYDGYKVTCYSNKEELVNELMWGGKIRKCEDALKECGCIVETSLIPLMPNVIVDRELITGQNPASADQLGQKFVQMLEGEA